MTFHRYLKRDFTLFARNASELVTPLIFYIIAIAMFPLGISPESAVLTLVSVGLIWVVALFSMQFSLTSLFRDDYHTGVLEQLVQHRTPLSLIAFGRIIVYWFCFGLPIALCAPLLAIMTSMPNDGLVVLLMSLSIGTLGLASIGAIGSALTVSLRKGQVVMTLVVLPLFVPFLIFGAGSVSAAISGVYYTAPLLALLGITILAVSVCPLAVSAGLRMSVENG